MRCGLCEVPRGACLIDFAKPPGGIRCPKCNAWTTRRKLGWGADYGFKLANSPIVTIPNA